MRRKIDMWQELDEQVPAFLPEIGAQETQTAVVEVRERLDKVETQLMSQYTSIAAYAEIAKTSVETARAEARADLDREKGILVSLVERARDEWHNDVSRGEAAASVITGTGPRAEAVLRLTALEGRFERVSELFAECLRNQEELANSIASLLERQMRPSVIVDEPAASTAPASEPSAPCSIIDSAETDPIVEANDVLEMMALQ